MLRLAAPAVLLIAVITAAFFLLKNDDKGGIDNDQGTTNNSTSNMTPSTSGSSKSPNDGGLSVRTQPFESGGNRTRLKPASIAWTIKGKVEFIDTPESNRPPCEVSIALHPDSAAASAALFSLSASTNNAGAFNFTLPSDYSPSTQAISLVAISEGFVGERVTEQLDPHRAAAYAEGSSQASIDIRLPLAAATEPAALRVLSAETARPIDNAMVRLANGHKAHTALTDKEGRASIQLPSEERLQTTQVIITAKGHAAITFDINDQLGERTVLLPRARTLKGGIWNSDGQVVSDALISIIRPSSLRASTRTNNDGQFALPIADDGLNSIRVAVWHKDHAPTQHEIQAGNIGWQWDVRLPRTDIVKVQVNKPDGTPMPGAMVDMDIDPSASVAAIGYSASRRPQRTNAEGKAECKVIGRLARGLSVRAQGFPTQRFKVSLEETSVQVLTLKGGRRRRGIVVSANGQTIEGALIRLEHRDTSTANLQAPDIEASRCVSNAHGEFTLHFSAKPPPETLYLAVTARGYTWNHLKLSETDPSLIKIVLNRSVALEGIVTRQDGMPVTDFWVEQIAKQRKLLGRAPGNGPRGHHFTQRFDGRFRYEPGTFTEGATINLAVRAEGLAEAYVWDLKLTQNLEPLPIRLKPAGTVTGRIISAVGGSPLSGAMIGLTAAWEEGEAEPNYGPLAWTEPDGTFKLANVAMDSQQIRVSWPNTAPLDVILPTPDTQGVRALGEIRLALTGALSLCAQNPTEEPLADTAIELTSVANRQMSRFFVNDQGKAEAEYLTPGKYELVVKSSVRSLDGLQAVIEVAPGSHQTVIFKPTAQRSTVHGTVALAGQPAPGVHIDVFQGAATDALTKTQTDSLGGFSLNDLEPGTYRLVASFVDAGEKFSGSIEINLTADHPPIALELRKH